MESPEVEEPLVIATMLGLQDEQEELSGPLIGVAVSIGIEQFVAVFAEVGYAVVIRFQGATATQLVGIDAVVVSANDSSVFGTAANAGLVFCSIKVRSRPYMDMLLHRQSLTGDALASNAVLSLLLDDEPKKNPTTPAHAVPSDPSITMSTSPPSWGTPNLRM